MTPTARPGCWSAGPRSRPRRGRRPVRVWCTNCQSASDMAKAIRVDTGQPRRSASRRPRMAGRPTPIRWLCVAVVLMPTTATNIERVVGSGVTPMRVTSTALTSPTPSASGAPVVIAISRSRSRSRAEGMLTTLPSIITAIRLPTPISAPGFDEDRTTPAPCFARRSISAQISVRAPTSTPTAGSSIRKTRLSFARERPSTTFC